jgi:hypothetical protein
MKKVDDFRRAAAKCRELAKSAQDNATRKALVEMAKRWDALAVEREIDVARQGRIRAFNRNADLEGSTQLGAKRT